jgi:hypothetical protein
MYTQTMSDDVLEFPPDPVIEAYKKDIDRTLLRENLKLSPEERLRKMHSALRGLLVLREAFRQTSDSH